jgi:HEAT repeat protein
MEMNPAGNVRPESGVARDQRTAAGGQYLRTGLWILIVAAFCGVGLWRFGRGLSAGADPLAGAIDALGASSPSDRVAAIQQVSQLGMADVGRSIPPITGALGDTDPGVRARAAEALALLGSYAMYNQIPGAQPGSGGEASIGGVTSALLAALAKDDQPSVRAAAAGALGNICATEPKASQSAKGSKKGRRKGSAADSVGLATAGPPAVEYNTIVDALVAALGDPDDKVRSAAAAALGSAGPKLSGEPLEPLVAALSDKSPSIRAAAVSAIPSFPRGLDRVLPSLIAMGASQEGAVRDACAVALGQLKPPAISSGAVPALVEGLKSPDREVRLKVVALLSLLGSDARPAIPALIKTLKEPLDSDRVVMGGGLGGAVSSTFSGPAHESAKLLGRIGPDSPSAADVIAALADIVRTGAPQRSASAAQALGEFGASAAATIPDLIQRLKAVDPPGTPTLSRTAEAAAKALARIAAGIDGPSAQNVVAALRLALNAESRDTRAAAIRALQELGPKAASALPQIKTLQEDPDPRVRKAASDAVEALEAH